MPRSGLLVVSKSGGVGGIFLASSPNLPGSIRRLNMSSGGLLFCRFGMRIRGDRGSGITG